MPLDTNKLKVKLSPETLAKLEELHALCEQAEPKPQCRNQRFSHLYDIYERLRLRGFSRREAIEWLVEKGGVEAAMKVKAENALKTLAVRRGLEKKLAALRMEAVPAIS